MKSLAVASLTVLGLASNAAASINVLTPWKDVSWKSGGHADVTWNADGADAKELCHIQLMNGNTDDGQIVAYVTNPAAPVPCSDTRYDIAPLNDFTSGDYWIRVGTDGRWSYSSKFQFEGKGSIDTKKLNAPVNVLLGEPAPVISPGDGNSAGTNPTGSAPVSQGTAAPTATGASMAHPSNPSGASSGALPTALKSAASAPTPPSGSGSGSNGKSRSSSSNSSSKTSKNVKTESSASGTQSGWMMAGVAALFAAMTL
ncbi:hypothetical protein BDB00DRAFT_788248 [Zychaea mexicana]|uniref:uncharacterized protein n=1 Tax=Zychaea mexicana TaxID=64656 RepID=UPI0022FE115A|nr:uncharacterized protein BDB00DRAFT_788248 [Zychaea mexicana]KAI9493016.1 hypothetical protein BDB00DRAFT_788248 [Zychaea mexicana]